MVTKNNYKESSTLLDWKFLKGQDVDRAMKPQAWQNNLPCAKAKDLAATTPPHLQLENSKAISQPKLTT
jgi:hypothetical protein